MNEFDYECALTGVQADGVEDFDEGDELEDLPVSWTRIRITRRQINPKWRLIQQIKAAAIQGMLMQLPTEQHEFQLPFIALPVEAQFKALEDDTPMYINDVDEVVFISAADEVVDDFNEVLASLGLDPMASSSEEAEEDEEGESA